MFVKFPKQNLYQLCLKACTSANFNDLPNGASQGSQVVFFVMNRITHALYEGTHQELKELFV